MSRKVNKLRLQPYFLGANELINIKYSAVDFEPSDIISMICEFNFTTQQQMYKMCRMSAMVSQIPTISTVSSAVS